MYTHKRQVAVGSVLSAISIIVAIILAVADPFGSSLPGVNFSVMAIVLLFTVWTATITVAGSKNDEEILKNLSTEFALLSIGGAGMAWMAVYNANIPGAVNLIWASYATALLAFFVSASITYLAAPAVPANVSELRRTA